ncbi:MAG: hypothetical protein WD492_05700 [Alkalispirochaeta sp.]
MKHRALLRSLFVVAVVVTLSSCLSTDVTIDLRHEGDIQLQLTYTIPRAVWELGVFDSASPERAIPVSERDAQEAADLYEDVTLTGHTVREDSDAITVEMEYSVGSAESLAGLWGWAGDNRLELDLEAGSVRIPVNGNVADVDREQRELILEVFRDQQFAVTLVVPGTLRTSGPDIPDASWQRGSGDGTATWTVPMGPLVLHEDHSVIEGQWEVP